MGMYGGSAPEAPDPKETAAAQTNANRSTAISNAFLGNVNQVTPYGNLNYNQTGQAFSDDADGQTYWKDGTKYLTSRPTISGKGTPPQTKTVKVPVYRTGKDGQQVLQGYRTETRTVGGSDGGGYNPDFKEVKGYLTPTFTATQSLSPEEKRIFDQNEAARLNIAGIGNQQSAFLQDYLAHPVDLSTKSVNRFISDHYSDDFNKSWGQNQTKLETQLANKGINIGSEAYARAMADFHQSKADAHDNMYGNQYQSAVQNLLTSRNQPLNEISALLSGSQVQQPNFVNTNMPTIPTTDVAGIIQTDYANRLNAYQMQQQQKSDMLGGLFSLGSSAIIGGKGSMFSDRRLKTDVQRIGTTANGLPVYAFRYLWGGPVHVGFMADEVAALHPEAVHDIGGFLAVDYEKAVL